MYSEKDLPMNTTLSRLRTLLSSAIFLLFNGGCDMLWEYGGNDRNKLIVIFLTGADPFKPYKQNLMVKNY